jgi:hypothetical protein
MAVLMIVRQFLDSARAGHLCNDEVPDQIEEAAALEDAIDQYFQVQQAFKTDRFAINRALRHVGFPIGYEHPLVHLVHRRLPAIHWSGTVWESCTCWFGVN